MILFLFYTKTHSENELHMISDDNLRETVTANIMGDLLKTDVWI